MSTVRALRARLAGETGRATAWMYAGRGIGLAWALLLTDRVGIAGYGRYAVAIALSALIAVPADHYFIVRVPRVAEPAFAAERVTRLLLGAVLVVVGTAALAGSFVIGFAVAKAGAEIAFNAVKSAAIRAGTPASSFRTDTARQVLSAVLTGGYLLAVARPGLGPVALLTLAGFVPFLLAGWAAARGPRPAAPEWRARTGALLGEALGGAAFQQLDIVLVGALASQAAAGYYAYGSLAVWALAALGQNYSYTFHEPLRAAGGDPSAGPTARASLGLALGTTAVVGGVALILGAAGVERDAVLTFAVLAPVTGLCTLSSIATTVLILQGRDGFRVACTWAAVVVKTALIGLLVGSSADAALAFLVAAAALAAAYVVRARQAPQGVAA